MKVFISGINGFLGSHIALALLERGAGVIGLARKNQCNPLIAARRIDICLGDLNTPLKYKTALRDCQAVIHCAALTSFGSGDKSAYFKSNWLGTKELLLAASECGVRRFIHCGTRGTLGVACPPENSDENCAHGAENCRGDYLRSKYLGEREVLNFALKGNMLCSVLSPTALLGAHDYRPSPAGRIIQSLLRRKIYVYLDGGINVIDVRDAAAAFVSALEKARNGDVYILGAHNVTLRGLFKQFCDLSGMGGLPLVKVPLPLAYAGSWLVEKAAILTGGEPFVTPLKVTSLYSNFSYCNCVKALRMLALPQTPLERTCAGIVDWFNSVPLREAYNKR
ncbi:MAG: NAD-dependent epimerase/dehydratase family protein [Candidatus Omnitrophota bacterium]